MARVPQITAMIRLKNIEKSYDGHRVLSGFSADIGDSETVILFGDSGAGKTTLLRLMLGLEKPDSGSVDVTGMTFSAVFQEDRLCAHTDAVENVTVVTKTLSAAAAEDELKRLLPEDRHHMPVSELSGGEKRRVAIVRAMCHVADAYLLDEPFTGLDEDMQQKAMEYILEKTAGKTLIITAHEEWQYDKGRKIAVG